MYMIRQNTRIIRLPCHVEPIQYLRNNPLLTRDWEDYTNTLQKHYKASFPELVAKLSCESTGDWYFKHHFEHAFPLKRMTEYRVIPVAVIAYFGFLVDVRHIVKYANPKMW